MDDRVAWLTLAHASELHAGQLEAWFALGRSPLELLQAGTDALSELSLQPATVTAIRSPDRTRIDADLAWLEGDPQRRLLCWGADDYPALLAHIPDPPLALYVEGNVDALSLPQLAIVGSRNPTPLGRDTAHRFAAQVARAGFAVTSGLAYGIDAAAHRGALDAQGRTIAVVGRGLDAIYPREHDALAQRIREHEGALVTDLPVGTPPLRQNFPRRNRILSGLAVGTLVVEAALQSGSLITARLAAEQGREVFAIPGSIHSPLSRGCHKLLRQGAKLVETESDIYSELAAIVGELAATVPASAVNPPGQTGPRLDKDYEILLDAVGFEPASLDELVGRTRFKTDAVASMLLILELDGRIQQQPGGRYSRRLPGKV